MPPDRGEECIQHGHKLVKVRLSPCAAYVKDFFMH